jgi:HAMP domain-containing protein
MTTSEKVVQLHSLLGKAGAMHFERIKLAKEIISDNQWIISNFNGDESLAAEALEEDYLGDLCGAINFWRLMNIIEVFPNIKDWERHKFNLTKMSALIDSQQKKKANHRWSITQREYDEVETERNRLRRQLESSREELKTAKDRISELETAVSTLIKEKARLEGEIANLTALIKKVK